MVLLFYTRLAGLGPSGNFPSLLPHLALGAQELPMCVGHIHLYTGVP